MEALALHTGAPIVHREDNTSYISVFEAMRVITMVKHIGVLVCFIQDQFDNFLFIPKYEESSVMPEDMCTKPFSGPIIGWGTKWINGFRLYPTS